MKCQDVHKLFPLYYDSEGDAESQLQIADHLAMCPDCKEWFQRQSRHEAALADALNRPDHGPQIWENIRRRLEATARSQSRPWPNLPRTTMATLLALAAGLLVAVMVWQWIGGNDPGKAALSELAAVEHDRYVSGRWQAEIVSGSVAELERGLGDRAGFRVRCPPQGQGGFRLAGGGLCQLQGQRGVQIVGNAAGQPISVFVLPRQSLQAFPEMRHHLSGEGAIHHCTEGRYDMVASLLHGHVVMVFGQRGSVVLSEILRGYGNYHAGALSLRPNPI